jgi:hypothetical protein
MQSATKTLVVTSVNPYSKLDYQQLCFQRWKSVGMTVVSCNTRKEAEILIKNGWSETDIRHVQSEHSGQALFGKPVPLIQPLLAALETEQQFDSLVLANSDIYPAIRSNAITCFWAAHAPALALTREETHDLSSHAFDSGSPYRGGLDVFFLQRSALRKINRILERTASSARMAFGIPGWDYLMACCLLSNEIGGRIFDSHVLLHQSHQPTYGNMTEFGHYVPDLQRLGVVTDSDPSVAAAEFAALIEQQCHTQRKSSRVAKLLYYRRPDRTAIPESATAEFEQRWQHLMQLAPGLESCYRKGSVASLYRRMASDSSGSLDTAMSLLCNSESALFQFNQALFAIVLTLMARAKGEQPVTQDYPKGNQHAAALRNILNRHDENDPLRRLWIARLFGSELVDHNIFNPRLYQYLVLASDNDCELKLVQKIKSMTRSKQRHAA